MDGEYKFIMPQENIPYPHTQYIKVSEVDGSTGGAAVGFGILVHVFCHSTSPTLYKVRFRSPATLQLLQFLYWTIHLRKKLCDLYIMFHKIFLYVLITVNFSFS